MKRIRYRICLLFAAVLLLGLMTSALASGGPSAQDLKDINSGIEYPKDNEYFSEYRYATIKAPGGHSVYAYGSADHLGSQYTALDGDRVLMLAERNGYTCCIVLSQNRGRWINSNYLIPEPVATPTPTPVPPATPKPVSTPRPVTGNSSSSYLDRYKDMISEIQDETTDSYARLYNTGMCYDFNGDGYKDLALLYSKDGKKLYAKLACRKSDGKIQNLEQYVCDLVDGSRAVIHSGSQEDYTLIHISWLNEVGSEQEGRDSVILLTEDGFEVLTKLEWVLYDNGDSGEFYVDGEKNDELFSKVLSTIEYEICSWPDDNADSLSSVMNAIK